jgi:hypothetical protein
MASASALHQQILRRFREAFGEPDTTLRRDDHWAIKPGPDKLPINVLVNGTAELPAIWVFDPHDPDEPVMKIGIHDSAEIDEFIDAIEDRVIRAKAMMQPGRDLTPELQGHPLVRSNGLIPGVFRDVHSSPLHRASRSESDGSDSR